MRGTAYYLITPKQAFINVAHRFLGDDGDILCEPLLWKRADWTPRSSVDEIKHVFMEWFSYEYGRSQVAAAAELAARVLEVGMGTESFDEWWQLVEIDDCIDLDEARQVLKRKGSS